MVKTIQCAEVKILKNVFIARRRAILYKFCSIRLTNIKTSVKIAIAVMVNLGRYAGNDLKAVFLQSFSSMRVAT